jgi:hypothetical protein
VPIDEPNLLTDFPAALTNFPRMLIDFPTCKYICTIGKAIRVIRK